MAVRQQCSRGEAIRGFLAFRSYNALGNLDSVDLPDTSNDIDYYLTDGLGRRRVAKTVGVTSSSEASLARMKHRPVREEVHELGRAGDLRGLAAVLERPDIATSAKSRKAVLREMATLNESGRRVTFADILEEDPAASPLLLDALSAILKTDTSSGARRYAAMLLSSIHDDAATRALLLGLEDRDTAVQLHCVRGLGHLQAREAVPELIERLSGSPWSVRRWAADALAAIRDERGIAPLEAAAERAWLPWRGQHLAKAAASLREAVGHPTME